MHYRKIFHLVILAFLLLGIVLGYFGLMLNAAATIANEGAMQVVGVEPSEAVTITDGRPRKVAVDENVKLGFLVDRIRINFPEMTTVWKPVRHVVVWWGRLVDCPIESGMNLATIGDIMWWTGTAIFLLMLPIVFAYIPFWLARDGILLQRWGGNDVT